MEILKEVSIVELIDFKRKDLRDSKLDGSECESLIEKTTFYSIKILTK